MQLRPYQQAAVDAVYEHLRSKETNLCVVLPVDDRRMVCFLYMNGCKDGAIRRILKIDRQRLQQIKTQPAFDLIKAGIRNSE